jgi:hypothetical protein
LRQVEAAGGMPSRQTIIRWGRAEPAFAARMAEARGYGRARNGDAYGDPHAFDAGRAEAFLVRVRLGDAVRRLVRMDAHPGRETLNAWKARQPGFARDLEAAVAFARANRPLAWRFDWPTADRIMVRVSRGEPLPEIWKDPTLPGRAAMARWRRREPRFDGALKVAMTCGHRRRMAARVGCTPRRTQRIVAHIAEGGSILSAARAGRMPTAATLYRWVRTHRDFGDAVLQACIDREDWFADAVCDAAEAVRSDQATGATSAQARRRIGEIRRRIGQTLRYPGAARRAWEATPPSRRAVSPVGVRAAAVG